MRTPEQTNLLARARRLAEQLETATDTTLDDAIRELAQVPTAEALIDAIAYLAADIVESLEQITDEPDETPGARRRRLLADAEAAAKAGNTATGQLLMDLAQVDAR